jgi:hypothetical protein
MDEFKPTPRPWADDVTEDGDLVIVGANGRRVATLGHMDDGDAEDHDNGTLIVRAVNRYDALVTGLRDIVACGKDWSATSYAGADIQRTRWELMMRRARAALAAATGDAQEEG